MCAHFSLTSPAGAYSPTRIVLRGEGTQHMKILDNSRCARGDVPSERITCIRCDMRRGVLRTLQKLVKTSKFLVDKVFEVVTKRNTQDIHGGDSLASYLLAPPKRLALLACPFPFFRFWRPFVFFFNLVFSTTEKIRISRRYTQHTHHHIRCCSVSRSFGVFCGALRSSQVITHC